MARGMLNLWQLEEGANYVQVEKSLVLLALCAETVGLVQVDAHRCDSRLNVLMAADALGERAWLASRRKA